MFPRSALQPRTVMQTRTTPALVLTPGIQLALELLQIPTLELRDLLQQELLTNPLLDIEDEDVTASEDSGDSSADAESDEDPAATQEIEPELPAWAEILPENDEAGLGSVANDSLAENPAEWGQAPGPTLAEHLLGQLRLAERDPVLLSAAEFLVGCLDDRGYLGCSVQEAARHLDITESKASAALQVVQRLDPPGVGARDLRECLLLQLTALGREASLAWRVVSEQFRNLAARRHVEMSRQLRVQIREVEAAVDEIRGLRPHPGRLVAPDEVRYIYPDLMVERVDKGFEVYSNEWAVPRLRLSRWCRQILAGEVQGTEAGEFARSRLRSARWLVQALDRRRATMLRVAERIVEEQREFFDHGLSRLRPLTLNQVAMRLGLHESTVARVVRSKYMQTPGGIYPMRFFFSSSLPTRSGPEASSRAVRERLRAFIEEEDQGRPFSDAELAAKLHREGIRIARRTVAKYRESLKIEPARLRRRRAG